MNGMDTKCAKKILIVDDEPHIIRVLKLKLENAGYEVVTAANGNDGLEKFLKEKPSVVISDIYMPHLNGEELYNMMASHWKNEPCFVIVMTSSVDQSLHGWAKEISNINFVEKPFSPSNILKLINEYFSKQLESNATL